MKTYTVKEAADMLGVTVFDLYAARDAGVIKMDRIPTDKPICGRSYIWMVPESELEIYRKMWIVPMEADARHLVRKGSLFHVTLWRRHAGTIEPVRVDDDLVLYRSRRPGKTNIYVSTQDILSAIDFLDTGFQG